MHFLTFACVLSKLVHPSGLSEARVHITQQSEGRSQKATRTVLGTVETDKRDNLFGNVNPKNK